MPRVVLDEVVDDAGLTRLASTILDDPEGMAEFGGFYGRAPERLAPLLGPDRRAWLIVADGGDAGFLDADRDGDEVGLSWFVRAARRRQGVGRTAVGRLLGLSPWPDASGYVAAMSPQNAAGRALAAATGFRSEGLNEHGEQTWRRALPRRRSGDADPQRFLDRGGRLVAWPVRPADRDALLRWLAQEVLAPGEVVDERMIGERLSRTVDDPARARRMLVDHGLVERTLSGSEYALADDVSPPARP